MATELLETESIIKTKTELFLGEQVRFINKNNLWYIPLIDIAKAVGVDRSNLTKMVNKDDMFTKMVGMVDCTTPSGLQSVTAITRDGVIGILVKLRSSKSRTQEQQTKIKQFQLWAIETLGKVMDNKIDEIKPLVQKPIDPTQLASSIGNRVADQLQIGDAMARYANVDRGIACSMALSKVEFDTGTDLTMWKNLIVKGKPSKRIGVFLATELGQLLGFGNHSGYTVNKILIKLGYLNRIGGKLIITQRGEQYSEAFPRTGIAPSGKSYNGYDIRWQPEMLEILRKNLFEEPPKPEQGLLTGFLGA